MYTFDSSSSMIYFSPYLFLIVFALGAALGILTMGVGIWYKSILPLIRDLDYWKKRAIWYQERLEARSRRKNDPREFYVNPDTGVDIGSEEDLGDSEGIGVKEEDNLNLEEFTG